MPSGKLSSNTAERSEKKAAAVASGGDVSHDSALEMPVPYQPERESFVSDAGERQSLLSEGAMFEAQGEEVQNPMLPDLDVFTQKNYVHVPVENKRRYQLFLYTFGVLFIGAVAVAAGGQGYFALEVVHFATPVMWVCALGAFTVMLVLYGPAIAARIAKFFDNKAHREVFSAFSGALYELKQFKAALKVKQSDPDIGPTWSTEDVTFLQGRIAEFIQHKKRREIEAVLKARAKLLEPEKSEYWMVSAESLRWPRVRTACDFFLRLMQLLFVMLKGWIPRDMGTQPRPDDALSAADLLAKRIEKLEFHCDYDLMQAVYKSASAVIDDTDYAHAYANLAAADQHNQAMRECNKAFIHRVLMRAEPNALCLGAESSTGLVARLLLGGELVAAQSPVPVAAPGQGLTAPVLSSVHFGVVHEAINLALQRLRNQIREDLERYSRSLSQEKLDINPAEKRIATMMEMVNKNPEQLIYKEIRVLTECFKSLADNAPGVAYDVPDAVTEELKKIFRKAVHEEFQQGMEDAKTAKNLSATATKDVYKLQNDPNSWSSKLGGLRCFIAPENQASTETRLQADAMFFRSESEEGQCWKVEFAGPEYRLLTGEEKERHITTCADSEALTEKVNAGEAVVFTNIDGRWWVYEPVSRNPQPCRRLIVDQKTLEKLKRCNLDDLLKQQNNPNSDKMVEILEKKGFSVEQIAGIRMVNKLAMIEAQDPKVRKIESYRTLRTCAHRLGFRPGGDGRAMTRRTYTLSQPDSESVNALRQLDARANKVKQKLGLMQILEQYLGRESVWGRPEVEFNVQLALMDAGRQRRSARDNELYETKRVRIFAVVGLVVGVLGACANLCLSFLGTASLLHLESILGVTSLTSVPFLPLSLAFVLLAIGSLAAFVASYSLTKPNIEAGFKQVARYLDRQKFAPNPPKQNDGGSKPHWSCRNLVVALFSGLLSALALGALASVAFGPLYGLIFGITAAVCLGAYTYAYGCPPVLAQPLSYLFQFFNLCCFGLFQLCRMLVEAGLGVINEISRRLGNPRGYQLSGWFDWIEFKVSKAWHLFVCGILQRPYEHPFTYKAFGSQVAQQSFQRIKSKRSVEQLDYEQAEKLKLARFYAALVGIGIAGLAFFAGHAFGNFVFSMLLGSAGLTTLGGVIGVSSIMLLSGVATFFGLFLFYPFIRKALIKEGYDTLVEPPPSGMDDASRLIGYVLLFAALVTFAVQNYVGFYDIAPGPFMMGVGIFFAVTALVFLPATKGPVLEFPKTLFFALTQGVCRILAGVCFVLGMLCITLAGALFNDKNTKSHRRVLKRWCLYMDGLPKRLQSDVKARAHFAAQAEPVSSAVSEAVRTPDVKEDLRANIINGQNKEKCMIGARAQRLRRDISCVKLNQQAHSSRNGGDSSSTKLPIEDHSGGGLNSLGSPHASPNLSSVQCPTVGIKF